MSKRAAKEPDKTHATWTGATDNNYSNDNN